MTRFYGRDSKIIIFGTAGIDQGGELVLSDAAKCRAHKAAEIFCNRSFNSATGQILITGGYSKELEDNPPEEREARLIGKYLLEQYTSIPETALLYEDESTSSWDNYLNSLHKFPEFFEDALEGRRRLGLVSHPRHLRRVVEIGKAVLGRTDDGWYKCFPTSQPDNYLNELDAMIKTQQRIDLMQLAAD